MTDVVVDRDAVAAACRRAGVSVDALVLGIAASFAGAVDPWGDEVVVAAATSAGYRTFACPTAVARGDVTAVLHAADRGDSERSPSDAAVTLAVEAVETGLLVSFVGREARGLDDAVRTIVDSIAVGERVDASGWAGVDGPLPDGDGGAPARHLVPVHEVVRSTARRVPDSVAVESADRSLTYAELDRRSDDVACALAAAGVVRGDRVGLLLERGPDLVVALVGVLKAGAAYVGLDPGFPQARLALVLEDAEPRAILAHRTLTDRLPDAAPPILDIATIADGIDVPLPHVGLDDVAYLIFTSGSTGRPKGIAQLHRCIANLVAWQDERSGIRFERVLQFSSIGFDVHLQELFSTFAKGGTLVTITPDDQIDADRLVAVVKRHRVGTLFLTVSALTQLFAKPDRVAAIERTVTDLVVAGEQLHIGGQLEAFLRSHPDVCLHNHYGVSESHVVTAATFTGAGDLPARAPVGRPIAGTAISVLGPDRISVPARTIGEVWITGHCLARGYVDDDQTSARFHELDGRRWYQTGDLARWSSEGELEFVGRCDDQVKIRGRLVELGDVESALAAVDGVGEAVVGVRESASSERILVGWYSVRRPLLVDAVRRSLREVLPEFMVPAALVEVDRFPVGATGKIDRKALVIGERNRPELAVAYRPPTAETERVVAEVLAHLLGVSRVGIHDSFFDLGATSLTLAFAAEQLAERLGRPVATLDLFRHATVSAAAAHLDGATTAARRRRRRGSIGAGNTARIAIVGMSVRVPGASTPTRLWERLLAGDDCLTDVAEEEVDEPLLLPAGPAGRAVRHLGIIDDAEAFDHELFGFSPSDAAWLDPQHRVLLECAWEALESAGELPDRSNRRVGIFGGSEINSHITRLRPTIDSMADYLHALTSTDKDFLTSRVAYALGMQGPAVTVQTACSTSLVAVHMARRSLLAGECDLALAGGVSLQVPQRAPHLYEAGLIYSRDGRTRPFDASAGGTNITNGAVLVVLKRLEDARADSNDIVAVIRGSAINNDGRRKVGYAAPSVDGQTDVILEALDDAGVRANEVAFVEAHGTATAIGDAVEVEALTQAFVEDAAAPGSCVLTSVKGNLGHLNRAAGAAGLVKAALALRERVVPGTCHFREPHASLGLERTPFFISAEPINLSGRTGPLRAGVSSFGIGGTNAHVVLEEWVAAPVPAETDGPDVLVLSGRTATATAARAAAIADELERRPDLDAASVTRTCNTGRVPLEHRVAVVADDRHDLERALRAVRPANTRPARASASLAFVFPGQGGDVSGAGAALAVRFPVFRSALDEFCDVAVEEAGIDLRDVLLERRPSAAERAKVRTSLWNQLSVVAVGRATSLLLASWGIVPAAVAGHSTGEYTAACLSGALGLRDAVRLVTVRARLMDDVAERGGMTSITLPRDEALRYAVPGVHLAACNSRTHTVLAGRVEALDRLDSALAAAGVPFRRLDNHNPNHTPLMASIAPALREVAGGTSLQPPSVPLLSGALGSWVGDVEPADHWATHLVSPVRLADCFDRMAEAGIAVVVDVGPSAWMSTLAEYHFAGTVPTVALHDVPDAAIRTLLAGVGRLWTLGVDVDWDAVHSCRGRLVPLPTYPFERRPVPTPHVVARDKRAQTGLPSRAAVDEWTYRTCWDRTRRPVEAVPADVDRLGHMVALGKRDAELWAALEASGVRCASVADLTAMEHEESDSIVALVDGRGASSDADAVATAVSEVARAVVDLLASTRGRRVHLCLLTERAVAVGGTAVPGAAALRGLALVLPQEHPDVEVVHVDVDDLAGAPLAAALLDELCNGGEAPLVALRPWGRLVPRHERLPLARPDGAAPPLGGSIIITGGLGRVGVEVARHLGATRSAHVVLVGRTPLDDGGDDPRVAVRCRRFDDLRSCLEGRVSYHVADATDSAALADVVAAAERHGPLRGVVHAAAADIEGDDFLTFVADCDAGRMLRQARAKLGGVEALNRVLGERPLELRVLFSSLATVLGGLGYVGYTAASAAAAAAAGAAGWTVVHWDVWGLARPTQGNVLGTTHRGMEMAPDEALGRLDAILAAGEADVLVSTVDLAERLVATAARLAVDGAAVAGRGDADPTEVTRGAWERVLGVAGFDGEVNFFELGGDSLTALRVVLEVNDRLGTDMSPADMLRAQTFDQFAASVASHSVAAGGGTATTAPAVAVPLEGTRVSPLQHRWFHMAARGFGNLDAPFVVRAAVDPELLERALHEVVARHEVLRSTFRADADDVVQVVDKHWRPTLRVVDARPEADPRRAVASAAAALSAPPFNLGATPPFRATLVQLESELAVLLVRTHHIVFDGWSAAIFIEELDACYAALAAGGHLALAPAPQYRSFASALNGEVNGDGIRTIRRHWQQIFRGAPGPVRLPRRPDANGSLRGEKVVVTVPADLGAALRATASEARTTVFPLFVAAFGLLLGEATGERDLVFGTTVAGRFAEDAASMIGVFVNPLPIRVRLDEARDRARYLDHVQDVVIDMHEHQRYLLGDLVRHVEPFVGVDINETFATYILFQNQPRPQLTQLSWTVLETDGRIADPVLGALEATSTQALMRELELVIYAGEDGSYECNVWYRTGLFHRAQVEVWAGRYVELLGSLATPTRSEGSLAARVDDQLGEHP